MAKKPKGYYSADAIIGRAEQAAAAQEAEKKANEQAAAPSSTPTTPVSAAMVGAGKRSIPSATNPNYTITPKTQTGSVIPDLKDWDYRTAKTDLQGNPIQTHKFLGAEITPKGFDPNGNPYFGTGAKAWLQKWAYKLSEEKATDDEADKAWGAFWDTASQFSQKFVEGMKPTGKIDVGDVAQFINPAAKFLSADNRQKAIEGGSLFIDGVQKLYSAIQKSAESSKGSSFLTPVLRGTNAAVGMTLEVFQEVSEIPEQILGAQQAARDYADAYGSVLPELDLSPDDANNRLSEYSQAVDIIANAVPIVGGYNFVRFWAAPGTLKEKTAALKAGWTEGNMLYSELVQPTIRSEYQQRVKAGEDPYLLTVELQNPWAELVGEMILDPLNVVGSFGKAKRAASTLEEAAQVVEKSGALNDASFMEKVADIGKVSTEAQASEKIENIVDDVIRIAGDEGRRVDSMQSWKLSELTPAGNRFRQHRVVGNFMSNAVQTIRHTGGSVDDVLDYVNAIIKRASGDRQAVKEAIATLAHSPMGNLSYNQAAFETGHILNKLIGDGDSLVKSIKAVNGDWSAMRKVLDDKIIKALDFQFASVSDLSKAADKAKELATAEKAVDSKTAALAEKFAELQKTNPGVVKWAKVEEYTKLTVGKLNGFLANNYFSLSYGYAFRNFIQNMTTLWADGGIIFEKGKFPTTQRLDDFLVKQFGDIPQALKGKTLTKTITEGSLGERFFNKLNAWKYSPAALADLAETYAGKMIYVKYYKSSMDNALQFGAALPDLATWNKAGFTTEQAQDFVNLIKASDYDEAAAIAQFNTKYGSGVVEKWKLLDWVNPEVQKGLEEYEDYWKQIVNLTNKTDAKQADIVDFFEDLKIQVRQKANKVSTEPTRINQSDPLWREIADSQEQAGKFKRPAMDNKEITLKVQFDRAAAELNEAFKGAVKQLSADPKNGNLVDEILDFTSDTKRQMVNEKAAKQISESRAWTLELRDKSRNTPAAQLWDEAVLGKPPANVTRENLMEAAWSKYFDTRQSVWGAYFKAYTDKAMDLAGKTGLEELFGKANKSLIELEQYRNYIYNDKGIFTAAPKFAASVVGESANGSNVRKLAGTYGLATATAEGKNLDQKLLNIINKYGDGTQYTKLDDIPLDVAEQAIAKYQGKEVKGFFTKTEVPEGSVGKVNLAPDEWVDTNGTIYKKQKADLGFNKQEAGAQAQDVINSQGFQDLKARAAEIRAKRQGFTPKPVTEGVPVAPPRDPNVPPVGHVYSETKQGLLDALDHVKQGMLERWGMSVSANGDAAAIKTLTGNMAERMAIARSKSQIVAEKYRDFALLPYGETTNMDFAMSLVYPYQFWYSRSYSNWMKRAFMTNPEIISRYANLKDAFAQEQKDLPDWWKSQLNVSKLFGIETENPVYINLEATVWPLYGLTGTDFNDPQKRSNWFTSMLDDMGKFGPSLWAPIQWAVAGYYAATGEKDLASKWGSRAIPVTSQIKAVSSFFGTPIELDPNVQLFSGEGLFDWRAADPYEEGRISRALAAMAAEGVPEQQLIEAARTHKGDLWEQAYIRATQQRAGGQLMSYFLGVGFKTRTQADVETDKFYAEYARMKNLHDAGYMTDAQYAQGFNDMREKYPFMDVILLSRRAGMGRDAAYAYNVISRIPPGMSKEIYQIIGVDPETAQKFYDSGGKLEGMSETERSRFMAAMVDAGAMLAIPSNTTRREWTTARNTYQEMQKLIAGQYGEDIQDKISVYFGIDNTDSAREYLNKHPEVEAALDAQTAYIANTPNLMKYYGGIDTLERYYNGMMYDKLEQEFGDNIVDIASGYYDLYSKADKRNYLKQHPELKDYWDRKAEIQEQNLRAIVQFGDNLPTSEVQTTGNTPENPVQQEIQQFAQPQTQPTFQEWQGIIGQPMSELIQDYWYNNEELPREVESSLDYMASQYGYNDGNEMLRAILMSMQ